MYSVYRVYTRDSLLGGIARTGEVDGVCDVGGEERKSSSGVDAVVLWAVAEETGVFEERVDEQADCTQRVMI